jgi:hypothetical protein
MLNKCSRSADFSSLIMNIWISGVTGVCGYYYLHWLNRRSELGVNNGILCWWVGWFRKKLPVKFRHHQTSYLSHILSVVNIKSQFDIYFRSRKTPLKKLAKHALNYTEIFKYSGALENVGFTFIKHSCLNVENSWLNWVQNILYLHPPQTLTTHKTGNLSKKVKFTRVCVTIFALNM